MNVALESNPLDPGLLKNCAIVIFQIEKLTLTMSNKKKNMNQIKFQDSPTLKKANSYFVKCLKLENTNASNYVAYAQFLEIIGRKKEAELHYLHALTLDPCELRGLYLYANFLQINDKSKLADLFFQRWQNIKESLLKKQQEKNEIKKDN